MFGVATELSTSASANDQCRLVESQGGTVSSGPPETLEVRAAELDTLVFTAGIGDRATVVRARICDGLAYLGLQVDPARNAVHAPIISSYVSRVVVHVIPTDEDLIIARHTHRLIEEGADHGHHV
jgi:Acetokinase family